MSPSAAPRSPVESPQPATSASTRSTTTAPPHKARSSRGGGGKKKPRGPVRRRGAKATDEEDEEDEEASVDRANGRDAGDSSESDFDPDSGNEDEEDDEEEDDEEEDDEDDEDDGEEPKTPATASIEQLDRKQSACATPFDAAAKATTSGPAAWSDMPLEGEAGSSSLPELDFANLSVSKLDALPDSTSTTAAPSKGLSKKQAILQKKLQKSEELKQKDPALWEVKEKERKERLEVKRVAKKERQKEKRKERKLAEKEQRGAASHDAATPAQNPPTSTQPPSRPVVPSRPSRTAVALGLNKPATTLTPDPAPTAPVASTSRAQQPAPAPSASRAGPRVPPSTITSAPPVDYLKAREAYTRRLASDPSYIPKVGKFWGHDDRLASPEVRPLNPFWRGRGGVPVGRGGRGAARGRGAIAQRGPDRWTAEGKLAGGEAEREGPEKPQVSKQNEAVTPAEAKEGSEEGEEDAEEDRWGRGEAKRAPRPSAVSPMPAWNHGGFEELEREEKARSSVPVGARGGRGGRGGARGACAGRGGFAGRGGTPGAINPRYAHLPFHPLHRFPAAAPAQPTPPSSSAPSAEAPEAPTTAVEPEIAAERPERAAASTVRLPSSGASAAHFALAVKQAAGSRAPTEPAQVISKDVEASKENTPLPASSSPSAAAASSELRKQQGASILYAADPSRIASASEEPAVAAPAPFSTFQQPQAVMSPPLASSGMLPFNHQLPPHLQAQVAAQHAQFIPRHASPAFYPNQAYYSPDGYAASMSSPGATPPPQLFSPQAPPPPASSFFLPPRSSKVEIKAPSRDGQSPAPTKQAVVSTNNTAYAIASQQMEPSTSSVGAVAGSSSPASTRSGIPLPPASPSLVQVNPYAPYSYSPRSSYEFQQQQQHQQYQLEHDAAYHPYPPQVAPHPYYPSHVYQHPAPPHPLSHSHSYYSPAAPHATVDSSVDPAILSMGVRPQLAQHQASFYAGSEEEYHYLQQQQHQQQQQQYYHQQHPSVPY
ncbi:hypothetical protein JCM10212_002064 [Sporobolomyces blumeae]